MASSRGRDRLRDRQNSNRCYAFGSSTPRDLSHMNKIPPKLRSYDAKTKIHREGPDLHVYMQKARSLTREVPSRQSQRKTAFGSSTPRDFSHLTAIDPKLRRYDAVIPKKSATSPEIQSPVKRSTTAPPINRQPAPPNEPKKNLAKDDDISSEPDFVQDREEFLRDLRKISKEEKETEEEKAKRDKEDTKTEVSDQKRMSIGEISQDAATFAHAAELATEVQRTERIPHNMHEEEEARVQKQTVKGMNDQIVVSDLTDSRHELDIEEKEKEDEKKNEERKELVGSIIEKVEGVSSNLDEKMPNEGDATTPRAISEENSEGKIE